MNKMVDTRQIEQQAREARKQTERQAREAREAAEKQAREARTKVKESAVASRAAIRKSISQSEVALQKELQSTRRAQAMARRRQAVGLGVTKVITPNTAFLVEAQGKLKQLRRDVDVAESEALVDIQGQVERIGTSIHTQYEDILADISKQEQKAIAEIKRQQREIEREVREAERVIVPPDSTKLGTGEYVDSTIFNKLELYQRDLLNKYGVDRYNEIMDEYEQASVKQPVAAAGGFWQDDKGNRLYKVGKEVDPDKAEYMLYSEWLAMPSERQDYVAKYGVDAYNDKYGIAAVVDSTGGYDKSISMPVAIWRELTPWIEEQETFGEFIGTIPSKVLDFFEDTPSRFLHTEVETQEALKAEYEAHRAAVKTNPWWWNLLFGSQGVTYNEATDTYGRILATEAPLVGGASKLTTKSAKKIADAIKKAARAAAKARKAKAAKEAAEAVAKREPVQKIVKAIRMTTTQSAKDIGMTEVQFTRFIKARVYNPSLTPAEFLKQEEVVAQLLKAARDAKTFDLIKKAATVKVKPKVAPVAPKIKPITRKVITVETLPQLSTQIAITTLAAIELARRLVEKNATQAKIKAAVQEKVKAKIKQQVALLPKIKVATQLKQMEKPIVGMVTGLALDPLTQTRLKEFLAPKPATKLRELVSPKPVTVTKVPVKVPAKVPVKVPAKVPTRPIRPKRPLKPPFKLELPDGTSKELTRKQWLGIVAWKSGIMYWLKYPDAAGNYPDKNTIHSRKPLAGVKYAKGIGSVQKSIIAKGGKIPKIEFEMGVQDVRIIPTARWQKPDIDFDYAPQKGSIKRRKPKRYTKEPAPSIIMSRR